MSTGAETGTAGFSRLARAYGLARRESGQGLVEFALVLPVLMIVIVGIIKVGIVYNNYITLNDSVRAGARVLAIGRGQDVDVCQLAKDRVVLSAKSTLDKNKLYDLGANVSVGSCNPGTSMQIGTDATVTASYPCDIKIPFMPTISVVCKASTTERVE